MKRLLMIAACALLAPRPAVAQTAVSGGWPETVGAKTVAHAATPATATVKRAKAVARPAADSSAELLRRHTELMERFAAALAEQRAVIVEQQRRIAALEALTSAAPVAPPQLPSEPIVTLFPWIQGNFIEK